ncbi:MAG: hypothetical protein WBE75_03660 [Candidatus Omnitrophota bacterium]
MVVEISRLLKKSQLRHSEAEGRRISDGDEILRFAQDDENRVFQQTVSQMERLSDDIREQERILHGMIERIPDQKFRDLLYSQEAARLTCRLENLIGIYHRAFIMPTRSNKTVIQEVREIHNHL